MVSLNYAWPSSSFFTCLSLWSHPHHLYSSPSSWSPSSVPSPFSIYNTCISISPFFGLWVYLNACSLEWFYVLYMVSRQHTEALDSLGSLEWVAGKQIGLGREQTVEYYVYILVGGEESSVLGVPTKVRHTMNKWCGFMMKKAKHTSKCSNILSPPSSCSLIPNGFSLLLLFYVFFSFLSLPLLSQTEIQTAICLWLYFSGIHEKGMHLHFKKGKKNLK